MQTNTSLPDALAIRSVRPQEVAQILGVGIATVWRWAKREDFPKPAKCGRCTSWTVGQIVAWRESQTEVVQKTSCKVRK
jgi:prophage regulatory protein